MSFFKRDKEKERFYLLPGMGGKAFRRKQNVFLLWSLLAGAVVAVVVAASFYFLNRRW
jgi:hypothetical protein